MPRTGWTPTVRRRPKERPHTTQEEKMWWGIGFGGAFVYLLLLFTLGLLTLRNGHGWMFFFGIFFPILWVFGAFMRPPQAEFS
jgi:hypothetical protein